MIGTCAAHISCNLMVTQQIGRIIIELPLPGKCRSILNYQDVFQEFLEDVSTVFLQKRNCRRELQDPTVLSVQTNLSLLSQSRGDPLNALKNLKPLSR